MANEWKKTSRGLALSTLEAIFLEDAYTNIALNKALSQSALSQKDHALVTEIVYGTVTRKMTLEWYLSHFIADRDKLEPWVYVLLMMSLYQMVYLDKIPHHASVGSSVEIAKQRGRQKGVEKLVNAVLRRIEREGLPDIAQIKRVNKRYAITYSLPVWLVKKLIDQFGEARAKAIFESLLVRSKASVRVSLEKERPALAEALKADFSLLSPLGLVSSSGHFASSQAFLQGAITIQDETSQLVAPTLDIKGDEQILDACSAPGGKTTHLASYLTTGQVRALDLYDHKLSLVRENAKRLGVSDRIVTQKLDATQVHKAFPKDSFDKILVDAPCSGIGLIRRKPDIRYHKTAADFESLQTIQLEILSSVCQTLKKGGIITYSTCTIFEEENQQVVARFLESHPDFEQVALDHPQKEIVSKGCLVITPEQFMTDGFFIAQFRRKTTDS